MSGKKWVINDERSKRIARAKLLSEEFQRKMKQSVINDRNNRLAKAAQLSYEAKQKFELEERLAMERRKERWAEMNNFKSAREDNNYSAYVKGQNIFRGEITPKHEWLKSYANDDWRPSKKIRWSDGYSPYQDINYVSDPIRNREINLIDKELTRKTKVYDKGLIRDSVFEYEKRLLENKRNKLLLEPYKFNKVAFNKTRKFFGVI